MLTYSLSSHLHQIAPFDARFPNTNQSKHCWQSYSDYYKCINARGEEFTGCKQFFKTFKSICPNEWVRFFFFVTLPKTS
jgi:cytochrome c oxidase subunit 6b